MSIKYYTHFLLQERSPKGMSEFRGVVEVNRQLLRGDLKEAASPSKRKRARPGDHALRSRFR